jgi:hypothetical protein
MKGIEEKEDAGGIGGKIGESTGESEVVINGEDVLPVVINLPSGTPALTEKEGL